MGSGTATDLCKHHGWLESHNPLGAWQASNISLVYQKITEPDLMFILDWASDLLWIDYFSRKIKWILPGTKNQYQNCISKNNTHMHQIWLCSFFSLRLKCQLQCHVLKLNCDKRQIIRNKESEGEEDGNNYNWFCDVRWQQTVTKYN